MTQERPDGPEQAGDHAARDREARLEALLSVDLAALRAGADEPGRTPRRRPLRSAVADARPDVAGPAAPVEPVAPEPVASGAAPPDADPGAGAGARPGRAWLVSWLSVVVLLALFATGIVLTYAGARIIRTSTEGEVREPISDPAAPGFEALVEPTPTLALIHDLEGEVDSITVLTLPSPGSGGGGAVFVPTRVVADMPIFGVAPIEAAYDLGTAQVQAEVVGDLLHTGIGEVAVVDAERWAGLVAPVAPLTVDNPDDLEVDGELRFPAGELELAPEDVGPYLEARIDGESDLARLFRHETFWDAWLTAVADAGGDAAVPGELETGLGRFVRELAGGPRVLRTLPVEESSSEDFGEEPTFAADVDRIAELVAELVPLPRSPRPGVRPRVRVLNGTDDLDAASAVAPMLPPAGVAVTIIGNAATFDHATTTIAYVGPEHAEAAEEIRALLGVGEVLVDPRPSDVVEITVTLGGDHD